MSGLIHSTSTSFNGPWWIDGEALRALDEILTQEHERLKHAHAERREQLIEDAVKRLAGAGRSPEVARQNAEREVDARLSFERPSLSIQIFATKDRHASVPSFAEAKRSEGLSDFAPVGFDIKVKGDGVDATLSLTPEYSSSDLHVRVSPETDQRSRELFVLLRNWADTHKPAWLLSFVWRFSPLFVMILFMLFFAGAQVSIDNTKGGLRQEARELLKDGIKDDAAERRALEIILQYQSDVVRTPVPARTNWMFWLWVTGSALLLAVIWWTPAVILGIARGQSRIRRWRAIHRAIFITVPVGLLWIVVKKIVDAVWG